VIQKATRFTPKSYIFQLYETTITRLHVWEVCNKWTLYCCGYTFNSKKASFYCWMCSYSSM